MAGENERVRNNYTNSLLVMPKPLQRRAIQLILNYLYLERPSSLSALHIHQLLTLF